MTELDRRRFLKTVAAVSPAGAGIGVPGSFAASDRQKRKFTMDLSCRMIGVRADGREAIRLADQYGFESVAPSGVPIDEQVDNRRELPAATGVIDLKAFLGALVKIGYDGPIAAEPFSRELRAMSTADALAATAAAMKKAFALVE